MKPNAAPAASARRAGLKTVLFCVIAGLTGLAAPAEAGDRALLDVIGFSGDARYFAFEEFGIQDGSGFAYANVHVVDLASDTWVKGSPFKARASEVNPDEKLASVRATAANAARATLGDLAIEEPADILALVGDGVAGDGSSLTFATQFAGAVLASDAPETVLTLSRFDLPGAASCTDLLDQPTKGFALKITRDGTDEEIYRDTRLPESRFCPMDYRLYAVMRPMNNSQAGLLAVVSSYPFGFEGPDRRFLVVPLPAP